MKSLGVERVLKGMSSLMLGTGSAKLLSIISIPILTRIYVPEDYGLLALFTASVMILVPILSLRYVIAIALPRTEGGAKNLLSLSLILVIFISSILFISTFYLKEILFSFFSAKDLEPYWWLMCAAAMSIGIYEALSMLALREKRYSLIARSQVFQSLAGESVKIGLGLLGIKPIGLLLGQAVSYSAGVITLQSFRNSSKRIRQVTYRRMLKFLFIYKNMALLRTPSQLLLAYSIQAPILYSSMLYEKAEVGQLSLALMAVGLPIILLGQSMSRAYYAEIASLGIRQRAKIREITVAISSRLFLISLPPALALIFFGDFIFSFIFGEAWTVAGKISSILAFYLTAQFLTSPLIEIFNLYGGQAIYLKLYLLRAILVTAAYTISQWLNFDLMQSITCYTTSMVCYFIFVGLKIYSNINEQDFKFKR